MTGTLSETFLSQLDELLAQARKITPTHMVTSGRAAVYRISGERSAYSRQCDDILAMNATDNWKADHIEDVLKALRADLAGGYLRSLSELIRGEVFADFLEMADHLLEQGYKDPAAVVAGAALEGHLRRLCEDAGLEVIAPETGRPRKADQLNAELAKSEVYSKLDQKSITSWLGLRNEAAHGHQDAYGPEQVGLLIASIRDFISRHP